MMYPYWAMPSGMMLAWVLFWIAIVALIVAAIWQLRRVAREFEATPLEIARRRYAAGAISQAEFEEICRALKQDPELAGHTSPG